MSDAQAMYRDYWTTQNSTKPDVATPQSNPVRIQNVETSLAKDSPQADQLNMLELAKDGTNAADLKFDKIPDKDYVIVYQNGTISYYRCLYKLGPGRICGKTFLSKYHIERHCRVHTGVKPYSCKLCNIKYSRREGLKNHLKNKHDIVMDDSYCSVESEKEKDAEMGLRIENIVSLRDSGENSLDTVDGAVDAMDSVVGTAESVESKVEVRENVASRRPVNTKEKGPVAVIKKETRRPVNTTERGPVADIKKETRRPVNTTERGPVAVIKKESVIMDSVESMEEEIKTGPICKAEERPVVVIKRESMDMDDDAVGSGTTEEMQEPTPVFLFKKY